MLHLEEAETHDGAECEVVVADDGLPADEALHLLPVPVLHVLVLESLRTDQDEAY